MHTEMAVLPAEYLTVKEYSDRIRLHPQTVYRWIATKRLLGVRRYGKAIRIDPARARLKRA